MNLLVIGIAHLDPDMVMEPPNLLRNYNNELFNVTKLFP